MYADVSWKNAAAETDCFHPNRRMLCKLLQPRGTAVNALGIITEKKMGTIRAPNCEGKLWISL
jgi:hypothetical protein